MNDVTKGPFWWHNNLPLAGPPEWEQLPPRPPPPSFWQIRLAYYNQGRDYAHPITICPPPPSSNFWTMRHLCLANRLLLVWISTVVSSKEDIFLPKIM